MTSSSLLQAFFYRSATANARVASMIETGVLLEPPLRGSRTDRAVLDEFDMGSRIKAKRMGRIYELLFCLENSMRELIERTLQESERLNEWIDGIKPDLLRSARKREEQDQEARWHGPRGESILNYLDFPDLGAIILDRWDEFQDLLGDRRWVERYFSEMNPTRRALAHTGDLSDFDVARMEMRVEEWLRVVG